MEKIIVSGTFNKTLSKKISEKSGINLANVEFTIFPNQEKRVYIKDSLKDKTVFVFESLSAPPDESLMEFLLLVDACRNKGAKKVIGVLPWLAYSAQDKVFRKGEPLSSKLVSRLMKAAGVDEVILLDVHSSLNIEYFKEEKIKVHHLSAIDIFSKAFKKKISKGGKKTDWIVLCMDKGARERSKEFAKNLGLEVVFLKKFRDRSSGKVSFSDFSGNFSNKIVISFDDFVSTGGSRIKASKLAKDFGAKKYIDCITHGLLGGDSVKKIQGSKIDKMYLTDSYYIPKEKRIEKIKILSASGLFAKQLKDIK